MELADAEAECDSTVGMSLLAVGGESDSEEGLRREFVGVLVTDGKVAPVEEGENARERETE